MPRSSKVALTSGVVLLLLSAVHMSGAQQAPHTDAAPPAAQSFALTDTKDLVAEPGMKAEAVEYRGRYETQFRDGTPLQLL